MEYTVSDEDVRNQVMSTVMYFAQEVEVDRASAEWDVVKFSCSAVLDGAELPEYSEEEGSLKLGFATYGEAVDKADFDGMCDRVGSEYWRQVLKDETEKEYPRPILAAVTNGHIVGFTGPVDKQDNGRGWFTGICTDPLYERRGIAGVLFNDLMEEFIKIGAEYSTLFTGTENHAQRLYLKTGFRPARYFAIMKKTLSKGGIL